MCLFKICIIVYITYIQIDTYVLPINNNNNNNYYYYEEKYIKMQTIWYDMIMV